MASKSSRRRRDIAARSSTSREKGAGPDPMAMEAIRILADLDDAQRGYVFRFYSLDPAWLSNDLEVELDGRVHWHDEILGRPLHLAEEHRRATIAAASSGFTSPFIAVLTWPEHEQLPVGDAIVVQGANAGSEFLRAPLHIMQRVHGLARLHFAALLGLGVSDGEWTAADDNEMAEITEHFQLRVEAEAVLTAAPYFPKFGL